MKLGLPGHPGTALEAPERTFSSDCPQGRRRISPRLGLCHLPAANQSEHLPDGCGEMSAGQSPRPTSSGKAFLSGSPGLEFVICCVTLAKSLNQKLCFLLCKLTSGTGPGVLIAPDTRWCGNHLAPGRGSVTNLVSLPLS